MAEQRSCLFARTNRYGYHHHIFFFLSSLSNHRALSGHCRQQSTGTIEAAAVPRAWSDLVRRPPVRVPCRRIMPPPPRQGRRWSRRGRKAQWKGALSRGGTARGPPSRRHPGWPVACAADEARREEKDGRDGEQQQRYAGRGRAVAVTRGERRDGGGDRGGGASRGRSSALPRASSNPCREEEEEEIDLGGEHEGRAARDIAWEVRVRALSTGVTDGKQASIARSSQPPKKRSRISFLEVLPPGALMFVLRCAPVDVQGNNPGRSHHLPPAGFRGAGRLAQAEAKQRTWAQGSSAVEYTHETIRIHSRELVLAERTNSR